MEHLTLAARITRDWVVNSLVWYVGEALLVLASMIPLIAQADDSKQTTRVLSVASDLVLPSPGSAFSVPVDLDDGSGVTSWRIVLSFPPEQLSFLRGKWGRRKGPRAHHESRGDRHAHQKPNHFCFMHILFLLFES